MTVALVILWFYVFGMMIRAVIMKQILWPQKQEDRDEGGWGKDEDRRTGEPKSYMPSRHASDAALSSMGGRLPRLTADDPEDGFQQRAAPDCEQIMPAIKKVDLSDDSSRSDIGTTEMEKADAFLPRTSSDNVYLTASRTTDDRTDKGNMQLGGQEV